MLAASVFGALAVLYGIRQRDRKLLKQGPLYAWIAFGGIVLAVVMMQRALITRDFSLAYVQQVGSADTPALYNIAAMWSALEGSILLWALMLARVHRRGCVAVPQAHRRRARRLGADRDVRGVGVLRHARASVRPTRSPPERPASPAVLARIRCCRTTSWCCSTRRSCTSATSASPCRSRSRSRRSSPAASARAG